MCSLVILNVPLFKLGHKVIAATISSPFELHDRRNALDETKKEGVLLPHLFMR